MKGSGREMAREGVVLRGAVSSWYLSFGDAVGAWESDREGQSRLKHVANAKKPPGEPDWREARIARDLEISSTARYIGRREPCAAVRPPAGNWPSSPARPSVAEGGRGSRYIQYKTTPDARHHTPDNPDFLQTSDQPIAVVWHPASALLWCNSGRRALHGPSGREGAVPYPQRPVISTKGHERWSREVTRCRCFFRPSCWNCPTSRSCWHGWPSHSISPSDAVRHAPPHICTRPYDFAPCCSQVAVPDQGHGEPKTPPAVERPGRLQRAVAVAAILAVQSVSSSVSGLGPASHPSEILAVCHGVETLRFTSPWPKASLAESASPAGNVLAGNQSTGIHGQHLGPSPNHNPSKLYKNPALRSRRRRGFAATRATGSLTLLVVLPRRVMGQSDADAPPARHGSSIVSRRSRCGDMLFLEAFQSQYMPTPHRC
ncbi:hypothetical protein EJ04DRAFT_600978 [Polyplosphaeria fusca]|uniref:Uncharacterized protein n=1 Tax=Polyplosphaeria fusca TaxID=682080 RepID=A0A9P4QYW9_9PLEO|nr:hypothetical protein EJ04DRAFT_600978 [Polyplosphaeria fusca]